MRAPLPYALPEQGATVRVAFVGQRTYVEPHLLSAPADGVEPLFVDHRDGADFSAAREVLDRELPDVVVLFRPDTVPVGALADLPCPVLGVATEPLPQAGRPSHEALDFGLAALARTDPANIDRLVLCDPLGWELVAGLLPAWRSMGLPVDDALFRDPTPSRQPPRIAFIGNSSLHRETALLDQKHRFDIAHYAHALLGEELRDVLERTDVGICLHGWDGVVRFPAMLPVHLAAGHLVLSEPIEPAFGLDPGIHYVEVENRFELDLRVHQLHKLDGAYDRVRIRGNHFAQQFRASRVWPRLLRDLFDDLRVFGTARGG